MKWYEEKNGRLKCLLCSHYCNLKNGQSGLCGVNKASKGKIECLVYGHIDALNIDPIEKKPLYHFLPNSKSLSLGTVGCNFKCDFCQNHSLSQRHDFNQNEYFSPQDIVNFALKHNCKSISYTYNEPTIFYPYAKDIAREAKKHNIKSVYVSNGFESKEVVKDMDGVVDALNIDLKSLNSSCYKSLGGRLEVVLENLKYMVDLGLHVEITTLIVPTQNDSLHELKAIANFILHELNPKIPWHISAFHPSFKRMDLPQTPKETLLQTFHMAKKIGLKHVYMGNIGVENPTICPNCGKILIQRQYFGVSKNELINSTCRNCGEKIIGVFS